MTNPLQSLWPSDIEEEDVLTPLAILNFQAGELEKKTNGRLKASIQTSRNAKSVTYDFEIVSPILYYRFRLFTVSHDQELVYPAEVFSEILDKWDYEDARIADTQEEFAKLIGDVLGSVRCRSIIQSLLARSAEKERTEPTPDNKTGN